MSQVRKANPEKNCFLQSDKLYIDSKIYVYNEVLGQVVEHSESVRSCITDTDMVPKMRRPLTINTSVTPQVWGHDVTAGLYDDDGGRPGLYCKQTRLQDRLQANIRSAIFDPPCPVINNKYCDRGGGQG